MSKKFRIIFIFFILVAVSQIFSAPGDLDSTFYPSGSPAGTRYTKITGHTINSVGNSVAVQSDGKIVVAGYAGSAGARLFAVARFKDNGDLDENFATGGTASTTITGQTGECVGNSVVIQSDGKIVVAGYARVGSGDQFAIARFKDNGDLDENFGTGGTVAASITGQVGNSNAYGVAIDNNGKIVVAGSCNTKFAVARFNINGTIDESFGTGGSVTTTITGQTDSSRGNSIAIQTNGKIVVAGTVTTASQHQFAVARFNDNGTLDSTFYSSGSPAGTVSTIITGQTGTADGLSVDINNNNGKIVVAGWVRTESQDRFAVAVFNSNGTLDSTFYLLGSPAGTVATPIIGQADRGSYGLATKIQQNGKIVVAGYAKIGVKDQFALARFNPDGTLDDTFNSPAGTVVTMITGQTAHAYGYSVAIDGNNGKIVMCGEVVISGQRQFAVARFEGDAIIPPASPVPQVPQVQPITPITTTDPFALALIGRYGPRFAQVAAA